MNDAAINDDADLEIGGDDVEPERRKLSGKKIVLFFLLPLLLLGGVGGGLMLSGVIKEGGHGDAASDKHAKMPLATHTGFYDLPEMLVNLNSTGRRPSFLKIQVSLEIDNGADVTYLQKLNPRIIDTFQVYLRELRIDDLRGSAGIYRLREELLARVNATVQPIKVKDVLFKEMLVQ